MGDLCLDGEIFEILSPMSTDIWNAMRSSPCVKAPCCNAVRNSEDFFCDLWFCSLVDGILAPILTFTNFISHRFVSFIENLTHRDSYRFSEDLVSSGQHSRSSNHGIYKYVFEGFSSSSIPYDADTSTRHCEVRDLVNEEVLISNRSEEVVEISYRYQHPPFLFQGLVLPLLGFRLFWRLAVSTWRCTFSYVRRAQLQLCSIVSRVQKTLRGSSDDIGWLQHTPGMAPVEDGTVRFLELLENIRNGEHALPNSYVYLLIPGLFSNHGPLYFVGTKRFFSKMGLACHIAKIHSESSVEQNAWELKNYIEELYWGCGKRVMLLGHSKGGVDAAAALSIYWSDLKDKVAGLALVQSPYGGTPLASDILREGQIADKETRRIMEFFICKIIKGDIRALEDLTYEKRKEFIMKHQLPEQIPLISFHSEANVAPGVLATMTRIAHAELPWFPLPDFGTIESDSFVQRGCQVPVVVPISAVMALCALHLQLRYGEKSDGLVTCRDAEVPGSVVVRPQRKLDHSWLVYTTRKKNVTDLDACEMCEAILTLLVEIGKRKEKEREEAVK